MSHLESILDMVFSAELLTAQFQENKQIQHVNMCLNQRIVVLFEMGIYLMHLVLKREYM